MNTLTKSLAPALAPSIRVNAVCPAFMMTKWFEAVFGLESAESISSAVKRMSVLGDVMKADDVADVVVFLCSDAAKYIVGELIPIGAGIGLTKTDEYKDALCEAVRMHRSTELAH